PESLELFGGRKSVERMRIVPDHEAGENESRLATAQCSEGIAGSEAAVPNPGAFDHNAVQPLIDQVSSPRRNHVELIILLLCFLPRRLKRAGIDASGPASSGRPPARSHRRHPQALVPPTARGFG